MKLLRALEKTIKSTFFRVAMGLTVALPLAMSYFSGLLDINSVFFKSKYFPIVGASVGAIVFLLGFAYWVLELKINEKSAKLSYRTSGKNIQINSIAYEGILNMLKRRDFETITSKHIENVETFFAETIEETRSRIESIVSIESLRSFDKIRDDTQKQRIFMYSMLEKLSNLNSINSFIRDEHSSCLNSIEDYLINWAKSNDIIKHLYESFVANRLDYDKSKFDLRLDRIEDEIRSARGSILEISMQGAVSSNKETLSRNAIFASMGIFIAGEVADAIFEEFPAEEIIYHILEDIGATIPFVAPVAIVSKFFRFLYRNRDRTEELKELRDEIEESITGYLKLICDYTVRQIEEDSSSFVNGLLDKFNSNFKRAKVYRTTAAQYF